MAEEKEKEKKTTAVNEPPAADPATTPELMTEVQRQAFALAERRRILQQNGMSVADAPFSPEPKKNDAAGAKDKTT